MLSLKSNMALFPAKRREIIFFCWFTARASVPVSH